MENRRGWVMELAIVMGLIASFALAVVLISCCACGSGEERGKEYEAWVMVLFQFTFSGAFGGCLYVLRQFNLEKLYNSDIWDWTRARFQNFLFSLGVSAMGGIGGAFAALYWLASTGKLEEVLNPGGATNLKNIGLGIVSGFIGFTLLKKMGESLDGLAGQVRDLKAETQSELRNLKDEKVSLEGKLAALQDESRGKIDTVDLDSLQDLDDAIRVARNVREGTTVPTDPAFVRARQELIAAREQFKDHRGAAIVLANMYYKDNKFDDAIGIVTETLQAIEVQQGVGTEKTRQRAKKNVADLLFNRACYQAKLIAQEPQNRTIYLPKVIEDLERSFTLSRENAAEAERDSDLESVKLENAFIKLIAKHK